jgi:hypothetical protein
MLLGNPSFGRCTTSDSTSDSSLLHASLLHTDAHRQKRSCPAINSKLATGFTEARSGTASVNELHMLADHGSVLAETQRQIASK